MSPIEMLEEQPHASKIDRKGTSCECIRHVRPNVLALDDFQSTRVEDTYEAGTILLELNEHSLGPCISTEACDNSLHDQVLGQSIAALNLQSRVLSRYPNTQLDDIKQLFCNFRNEQNGSDLKPSNLCISTGIDEMIDNLVRCLCVPGQDSILICPPQYHMYTTSAALNDISTIAIPLDADNDFVLQTEQVVQTLSQNQKIKVLFITTPGNPTGAIIPLSEILRILEAPDWDGILVVDEAYIDFASYPCSAIGILDRYPRLVILQSLSKSFGLAGIRVGFALACTHLSRILNRVRKPYSVSSVSIEIAKAALTEQSLNVMIKNVQTVNEQKTRLRKELSRMAGIGRLRGGFEGNFVLFEVLDSLDKVAGLPCNITALKLSEMLKIRANLLVRYKGLEPGCKGCIRATIGTSSEVTQLLKWMEIILKQIHGR